MEISNSKKFLKSIQLENEKNKKQFDLENEFKEISYKFDILELKFKTIELKFKMFNLKERYDDLRCEIENTYVNSDTQHTAEEDKILKEMLDDLIATINDPDLI